MQRTEVPEADPATGVTPLPRPAVPWRVVAAEALDGMRVRVSFVDGLTGDVRLQSFLEGQRIAGSIFEALRDPNFFRLVRVDMGAVTWPNGADLAPDAMYDAIQANGYWLVGE